MSQTEVEEVLSNWIREALSGEGELLPNGIEPARWVAKNFLRWWQAQGVDPWIEDAEGAACRLRRELESLGGFNNPDLGEAMHAVIHLDDALADIRRALGMIKEEETNKKEEQENS